MIKRKKLGQHFLNSQIIAEKITNEAKISKKDVVFELGTGLGILTPLLCKNSKKVISIEVDEDLFKEAKKNFSKIPNLTLKFGDGINSKEKFDIFVSNLPYSESKKILEWLAIIRFSHGVIMVQREFAEKLLTKSNKKRRAINVIANYSFDIQNILKVGKKNFSPNPKVDSIILKISKRQSMEKEIIEIINKIFSYRRKKISNIVKQFGKEKQTDQRLDDLSTEEIVELAKEIRPK